MHVHNLNSMTAARIGGWLFRQRGWLPVPLAVFLVAVRTGETESHLLTWGPGLGLIAAGLVLRFWAVGYISPRSRTCGGDVWYLACEGPYAWTRNPLYIGNVLIWLGVAWTSELFWGLPIVALLAIVEYTLIVCWEEDNLSRNFGRAYEAFRRSTPRWLPSLRDIARRLRYPAVTATKGVGVPGATGFRPAAATDAGEGSGRFSWAAALEGERYTWLNVALALALMLAKEFM